jgi:hypothetical protein
MDCFEYHVPERFAFNRVGVFVSSGGSGTRTCMLAIYKNDWQWMRPAGPPVWTQSINITGTGLQSVDTSCTLEPGLYWFGFTNRGTGTNPTYRTGIPASRSLNGDFTAGTAYQAWGYNLTNYNVSTSYFDITDPRNNMGLTVRQIAVPYLRAIRTPDSL